MNQRKQKAELSQTNVMVNNMESGLTKNDAPKMRQFFSQFGDIKTATVHVTGTNFAGPKTVFVEFEKEEDAAVCVSHFKKNKIYQCDNGLPIAAKFSYKHSDPNHKKPRSERINDNQSRNELSDLQLQQQQLSQMQQLQYYLAMCNASNPYMYTAGTGLTYPTGATGLAGAGIGYPAGSPTTGTAPVAYPLMQAGADAGQVPIDDNIQSAMQSNQLMAAYLTGNYPYAYMMTQFPYSQQVAAMQQPMNLNNCIAADSPEAPSQVTDNNAN